MATNSLTPFLISQQTVAVRDWYRAEIVSCRVVMEEAETRALATQSFEDCRRLVDLTGRMMDLLYGFINYGGGKVLAVPLFDQNCRILDGGTVEINVRRKAIVELVRFSRYYTAGTIPAALRHQQDMPGVGLFIEVHAIKQQNGMIHQLERLANAPQQNAVNIQIWKWIFVDLLETENVNTLVREEHRWNFCGWFKKGVELEQGEAFGGTYAEGHPDNLFGLV